MNVFISGGTGFIGRALTLRLRRDGHSVTVWTRNPSRARSVLGTEASFVAADASGQALRDAMATADAVVNLAGEPLLGGRWSQEKKRRILASRVETTRELVEAMAAAERRPRVFVSGSAVGFYGDGGAAELREDAPSGEDFLARVCQAWEAEAFRARESGIRVAVVRTGVVLGREDGALAQMLTPFRLGVGGPIGSGDQFVPWIHLDDLVELIATALDDERFEGAFNGSAPAPVTFDELATTLGRTLGRPSFLPVPSFAVRALFGEAAIVLLQGQRAVPGRALDLGFGFRFSTLAAALGDLLENDDVHIRPVSGLLPDAPYLAENPPAYLLETRTVLDHPIGEVFPFFSRAENLGLITPPSMNFRITQAPETMVSGARIRYRLKVGPAPISWTTRIDAFEPQTRFADSQEEGPYACWWHEHRFESEGDRTVMTDRVYYAPPLGPLGRLANAVFVAGELRRVFGYRSAVMRLRFGDAPD